MFTNNTKKQSGTTLCKSKTLPRKLSSGKPQTRQHMISSLYVVIILQFVNPQANAKMVATPVDVTVDEGKPTQRTERRKIIMTMESTLRKTLYLRSSNESGVKTIEQKGRK